MADNISIKDAQRIVDEWIKEYGVRYFSELTNMAVLTEEVGEMARIMARKYGDQSFKEGEKPTLATRWPTCCGCCSALPTRQEPTSPRPSARTSRRRQAATGTDTGTITNCQTSNCPL